MPEKQTIRICKWCFRRYIGLRKHSSYDSTECKKEAWSFKHYGRKLGHITVCPECRKHYVPKQRTQKYCTAACYRAAHARLVRLEKEDGITRDDIPEE